MSCSNVSTMVSESWPYWSYWLLFLPPPTRDRIATKHELNWYYDVINVGAAVGSSRWSCPSLGESGGVLALNKLGMASALGNIEAVRAYMYCIIRPNGQTWDRTRDRSISRRVCYPCATQPVKRRRDHSTPTPNRRGVGRLAGD
jgi:hypothetical protein